MHAVQIEVVLLSLTGGRLHWRMVRGALPDGARPDARARELAGLAGDCIGVVIHSTSWRPGSTGLILTYAVVPDPDPRSTRPVPDDARIVSSGVASSPSPAVVEPEHVLAHALRHLALIARTSAEVAAVVTEHPDLWDAVLAHPSGVAGRLAAS